MRLINKTPLVFTRTVTKDYFDINGEVVKGAVETVSAKGSLQPMGSGRNKITLPEGISSTSAFIYYTKTPLRLADQFTKTPSDTTEINGRKYGAFEAGDWTYSGLSTDHFKVVLIRLDQPTGV
jgi:hypothetical protein